MKKTNIAPTRLEDCIRQVLPDAHGHQQKALVDFVFALISVGSCCQAALADFFDNFEASLKRLSRLIHNERLNVEELALAQARFIVARLPQVGDIRIAIDWTEENGKCLLVASLLVGRRGVPLFWRAYRQSELKGRTSQIEQDFLHTLVTVVLKGVARTRLLLTADRGFADVILMKLLNKMKVSYVIRTKANVKVYVDREWRKLGSLTMKGNQRRRALGRLRYCQREPLRVYVTQARERNRQGKWGVWNLLSNRNFSAYQAADEYSRRWGCEAGFRDAKSLLGFKEAAIKDIEAWARMFTLVALALLVLIGVGVSLIKGMEAFKEALRQVRSRRKARSDKSLVRCVAELLRKQRSSWDFLFLQDKLNLEATL